VFDPASSMEATQSIAAPMFRVIVEVEPDRVLVVPHGELDLETVGELETAIERHAREPVAVVLDLRQLTFMDSTGLHLLLRLDAEARSDDLTFTIVEGDGPVRRLLTLTGLRDRFAHTEGR
jgi:anti-sigma B factor antagonist